MIPQGMMYRMRGAYGDGNAVRDRSGEQMRGYTGANPNMPIFNQPRSGAVPGPVQTMQTANQMQPQAAPMQTTNQNGVAPTKPMRVGGPSMPQFNTGATPGQVQQMPAQQGHSAYDAMAAMHPEWNAPMPAAPGQPATLSGWNVGNPNMNSPAAPGPVTSMPTQQRPPRIVMPVMGRRNAY